MYKIFPKAVDIKMEKCYNKNCNKGVVGILSKKEYIALSTNDFKNLAVF